MSASEILRRLDRIERRLAQLCATDAERRLLQGIAQTTEGALFTANELLRHATLIPALRALLAAALGSEQQAKRVGKFLARVEGCCIGGVSTERAGSERGSAIWRVWLGKPTLLVAGATAAHDDADSITESPCNNVFQNLPSV